MKTNAKRSTVLQAIENVNQQKGYQIKLNRDEQKGKWFNFTLKTDSKIPGARTSWTGRNMPKASWHAHGYIFDAIFEIEPQAIIYSGGDKITKDSGNWNDRNIGSIMYPCYFSKTSIL
jgi:hypothetical protein